MDGGEGYCNAVYIDDVIQAMLQAAVQPDVEGQVVLISGPEPISWKVFYGAFEQVLGARATAAVPEQKLVEMYRNEVRSQTLGARLKKVIWSSETINPVLKSPPVRGVLKLLKGAVPEERRRELTARYLPKKSPGRGNANSQGPGGTQANTGQLHVPDETLLALYRPQTTVRIDKARQLLGYEPVFDFERGMHLTAQFIRWANLVVNAPRAAGSSRKS